MKFKKKIQIRPAYDRRDSNPDKNYGISGCDMLFTLIGEKGAVTFLLFTGWQLPHVVEEYELKYPTHAFKPIAADIGYHSPIAIYEGQEPSHDECKYLGVHCYYDGSGMNADEFFLELLYKDSKGLCKKMKKYYLEVFEGKDNE